MPVRMKPEPTEPSPQMPYVQQLEQVIASQPLLRPPGPGSLYLPQNVQVLNYPPDAGPQSSLSQPQTSAAQKDQISASQKEKKVEENIEDRIDVDSIKGIFGWATIDGVNVPYIVRKQKKYVAVRIVEKKLLSRYPNSFPDELGKKEPLVSYFVTEHEAKLLDEINQIHCSYEYGHQPFSCKDLIVDMTEFEDFYNLVKKTFPDDYLAKLRGEIPQQQMSQQMKLQEGNEDRSQGHVKSELAKVCGWVQINNTVSPYIRRYSGKYVPLSVIKYAAGLLTDLQIDGTMPTLAECNLLNETCKAAGFDFTFGQNTKVIHLMEVTQRCQVNILELPFDDPLKHAQYLDLPSPTKAQQSPTNPMSLPMSSPMAIGQRPPGSMSAPNVNPFSGYPTAPPNPFFNMMPIMPQRFPQQSVGQYPLPPQGQRFPFMPPQNMPNSRPNIGSPPRQNLPSPSQISTSQHNQFQSSGQQPQNSPLSMMSQMAQNGQMHSLPGVYHGPLPPGQMGPLNPMIRPGLNPPTSQTQGPIQSMRMPMTAPLDIMPRGPMLHTAQMPQLSPSQSTISRFPNPHSMVSTQQVNNNQIVNKTSNTPNPSFPSSSPSTTPVASSPKTVHTPQPPPATNGETVAPQRPNSNQSSGQSRSSSRSPLVDKISGVVLNGKSISCMHLDEAERPGKFCLVEAVCKLYFSHSSMNEFLFALQNVLNIPLYPCTDDEEKAFIQYYNLPVSVLKCNKMISLTDLEKYFPQMSYMFNQCDTPTDGAGEAQTDTGPEKDSASPMILPTASGAASPGTAASPLAADGHPDASIAGSSRKRPSFGAVGAPPAKQPCRRLEEMVRKLKQSQNSGNVGDKQDEEQENPERAASVESKPTALAAPPADSEDTGRKDVVIVLD